MFLRLDKLGWIEGVVKIQIPG